jgi:hypothetical protein
MEANPLSGAPICADIVFNVDKKDAHSGADKKYHEPPTMIRDIRTIGSGSHGFDFCQEIWTFYSCVSD